MAVQRCPILADAACRTDILVDGMGSFRAIRAIARAAVGTECRARSGARSGQA